MNTKCHEALYARGERIPRPQGYIYEQKTRICTYIDGYADWVAVGIRQANAPSGHLEPPDKAAAIIIVILILL